MNENLVGEREQFKLAVCVILYYPDDNVFGNVCTYAFCCQRLFVVDNGGGDKVIQRLVEQFGDKIEVISFLDNQGIAKPLNIVLRKSFEQNYKYLMTMDQDSRFLNDGINNYLKEVQQHDWVDSLGVSAYSPTEYDVEQQKSFEHVEVPCVITSTNVVDIVKAIEIGGYEEKLFIDEVDNEFCLRGLVKGYKTYKVVGIDLEHTIGAPVKKWFIWRYCTVMNHGFVRKYYIVRNRLWVYGKYHRKCEEATFSYYIVDTVLMVLKTVLFENDVLKKLRYMFKGCMECFIGRMGKVY